MDDLKMVFNELGVPARMAARMEVIKTLGNATIFNFGAGAKLIKTRNGWTVQVGARTRNYALLIDAVNEFAKLIEE